MNMNEFKNQCKTVKAPSILPTTPPAADHPLNGLIDRLKEQEAKELQALKKSRPLWLVAATLFTGVFLVSLLLPPKAVQPSRLLFFGVLAGLYLTIATVLTRKTRHLAQVDYTESLRAFLDKAEQRCQLFPCRERWLAAVGLILLGTAGGAYVLDVLIPRYLSPDRWQVGMAVYCLGYLLVCALGFFFTYRTWKEHKAVLLAEIRNLKRDLMADEPSSDPHASRSGSGVS